jgi:two-component system sensor histidine kinase/response regulator
VKKVQPGRYDIVLMDIKMPVLDGIEASRIIRRNQRLKALPILAMTADVMSGDLEACKQAGINDSISKPIDPLKLFHTLARWVKPDLPPSQSAPASGSETPVASAAESFGPLPGIDVRAGLARVSGNVSLYRKLLLKFRDRHRDAGTAITRAVAARDLRRARTMTHTLKGVSGNLGAEDLFRASTELDLALRQENPGDLSRITAAVSSSLAEVLRSVARLEEKEEQAEARERAHPTEDQSLSSIVRRMAALLEWGDLESVDLLPELKARLAGTLDEPWLSSLEGAMGHFRFDEARKLLTEKARKLKIPLEGEGEG